jgi:hypothetical protein
MMVCEIHPKRSNQLQKIDYFVVDYGNLYGTFHPLVLEKTYMLHQFL